MSVEDGGSSMAAKKAAAKRKRASRRELIDTGTNKLFVRRNERGTSFKKVVDAADRSPPTSGRRPSAKCRRAMGDRGDRA
jgi:hypothetical protein